MQDEPLAQANHPPDPTPIPDELTAVKHSLAEVTAERDACRLALSKLERKQQINQLAKERSFSDPDYLDFLLETGKINYQDPEELNAFFTNLAGKSPRLFLPELKSGSGSNPAPVPTSPRGDLDGILHQLRGAPDVR